VFLVGLAVILALVLGVASMAMSATGKPFILGKQNEADQVTRLIRHGAGQPCAWRFRTASLP
jgi:hypothetical protein